MSEDAKPCLSTRIDSTWNSIPVVVVYDHLTDQQIRQLHEFYQKNWWCKGRTLEETTRLVCGPCLTIALVTEDEQRRLVGFARIITDKVIKALVFDVIVDEKYRGKGLGKLLLNGILNHPEIQGVKHVELYCAPEMEQFYRKWGFESEVLWEKQRQE